MNKPFMSLAELSRETGIPYYKITYAHQTGAIPEPEKAGCHRIYTTAEVQAVRAYFADRREPRAQKHRQPAT